METVIGARISYALPVATLASVGLPAGLLAVRTDVADAGPMITVVDILCPETLALPEETAAAPEILEPGHPWAHAESEAPAKVIWGEVRGCGPTHLTAVGLCALNRVNAPRWSDGLTSVLSQPNRFRGYDPGCPVGPGIHGGFLYLGSCSARGPAGPLAFRICRSRC